MFGTVVIGIGMAGSVRIRDLLNPLSSSPAEHLKLLGFVSRRSLDDVYQVKQISLQEALDNPEVHAAIISTDNQNHIESVRKFLEAGKHVLVEYPLALSAKGAHELWELAELKGKILHVEHIELLTEEYKQLKKEVSGKELVKGTLHFTGGPLDERYSGFPSFSGIARLTWLVDLFGDLTVTSATREQQKEKNYFRMTVHFQTANKSLLTRCNSLEHMSMISSPLLVQRRTALLADCSFHHSLQFTIFFLEVTPRMCLEGMNHCLFQNWLNYTLP